MARFEVVTRRNIGNAGERVITTTRRFNGAVAEADRFIEATVTNMRKHFKDARIVQGPTRRENEWVVITMLDDVDIADFVEVRTTVRG